MASSCYHVEMANTSDFYVYIFRDPRRLDRHGQSRPWYVGKGSGNRIHDHIRRGRFFKNYLKSMTCDPGVERIDCDSERSAFDLEKLLIQEIGRRDMGTGSLVNQTGGGDGVGELSIEARAKITAASRGRKQSPELIERRIAPLRGRRRAPEVVAKLTAAIRARALLPEFLAKVSAGRLGKRHSAEARAKMSAAARGRTVSDETRAKLSAALRGRKRSPEAVEKTAAARRGQKLSAQHVENMRAALTGRKQPPEERAKRSAAYHARKKCAKDQIIAPSPATTPAAAPK
jgi:hypothetical protein